MNEWRGWVVGANLKADDRNLWHVADFWRAIPVCLVWRRGGLFTDELTPGPWHSQNESLARQFSSINSPCGPQVISPSPPNAVESVIWSHRWKRLTSSWSSRPSGENQLTRSHVPHLAAPEPVHIFWANILYSGGLPTPTTEISFSPHGCET